MTARDANTFQPENVVSEPASPDVIPVYSGINVGLEAHEMSVSETLDLQQKKKKYRWMK
jgi:hypothetical protein